MALTLNQVVQRIRNLALAHHQINSFYFGDVPEFDANGEILYAGCFCQQLPGSINSLTKLKRYSFRVYFLDLVGVSTDTEGNETEVLSDMSSVASDFIAMLKSSVYQDDWEIAEVSPETPVTEGLGDMVAGCFIDIGIDVENLTDVCQVPADEIEFEEDFDMARTKLIPYTATGSEGETFTVSDIAGKIVLAAYRAGSYKRIITTTPTDTDKIRVSGTDLGSNKGIQATGNVRLSSGDFLSSGELLDFLVWSA